MNLQTVVIWAPPKQACTPCDELVTRLAQRGIITWVYSGEEILPFIDKQKPELVLVMERVGDIVSDFSRPLRDSRPELPVFLLKDPDSAPCLIGSFGRDFNKKFFLPLSDKKLDQLVDYFDVPEQENDTPIFFGGVPDKLPEGTQMYHTKGLALGPNGLGIIIDTLNGPDDEEEEEEEEEGLDDNDDNEE